MKEKKMQNNDNFLEYEEKHLMYVNAPHLVERYNLALIDICGKKTSLESFHIDASGYSPEIATEFDDPSYLDVFGINKKFIILSVKQSALTTLSPWFNIYNNIFPKFIRKNFKPLALLTAKTVIYGEVQNLTYKLESIMDLLDIQKVQFTLMTPDNIIADAKNLSEIVESYMNSNSLDWMSETKLNQIIKLAKNTGDITQNPVTPKYTTFKFENYYTDHFGGAYIFDLDDEKLVITANDEARETLCHNSVQNLSLKQSSEIYNLLLKNGLIHKFHQDIAWSEIIRYLRTKLENCLYTHIGLNDHEIDITSIEGEKNNRLIYQYYETLPRYFHSINKMIKELENGKDLDLIDIPDSMIWDFAAPVNNLYAELIHHLITNFVMYDYEFIYNHNLNLFYRRIEKYPDNIRKWIIKKVVH